MALRSPIYLDTETLLSQAEYHDIEVARQASRLIPGGGEGYLSAEQWLLHDWEYMIRRKLMMEVDKVVKDMVEQLDLDLPVGDVHAYITGPAIIVDAIGLY